MGVMIAGTSSGCGKTTISIGLMAVLKDQVRSLAPFKVGPDYIDPGFHTYATGEVSHNLDGVLLDEAHLKYLYAKYSNGKSSIVEGVMGLYDGYGIDYRGSSAHTAKTIGVPVVLVIDGKAVSTSAAAVVKGFSEFDKQVKIAGVIVNRVSGEPHYQLIKAAVEAYTGVDCLGYLPKDADIALSSRHLGLIPQQEVRDLILKIDKLKMLVKKHIDLDRLVKIMAENSAAQADMPQEIADFYERNRESASGKRIGVARDAAFSFYYQANLDMLGELGIEVVPFSPLEDAMMPDHLDAVYIGGGFPEVFADTLSSNRPFMAELKEKLEQGTKCYAECGGFMYLARRITTLDNRQFNMTGFYDMDCEMTRRLQRFGYVTVQYKDLVFNAHEFHHSRMTGGTPEYQYWIRKPGTTGKDKTWRCGAKRNATLAGYPHVHFYSNPAFMERALLND